MEISDKRIKAITEVLQNIRIVKFFAWENSFVSRIMSIRWEEISLFIKFNVLRSM